MSNTLVTNPYTGQIRGDYNAINEQLSFSIDKWTATQKLLFRFFFIYFLIQALPLSPSYFKLIGSIDWTSLYYGDIFELARYYPRFVEGPDSFINWAIVALIAIAGTLIWTLAYKKNKDYEGLYYLIRVILRYRLAAAVIAYGFIKLFPLQAPYPSISNLNTNYGDFTSWKLYTLSLGAAPMYEIFLGVVEILAGILLLFRKTSTIGAFLVIAFTGNVFLSNLAYEGGEHIYSLYLIAIAVFLVAHDFKRLVLLLTFQVPVKPATYKFQYKKPWLKSLRIGLKSSFVLFFLFIYGFKAYSGYLHNPHHIPQAKGLSNASGIYNVKTFVSNGDTIAYSSSHPVRWKDVVFENWATISIRSNREVQIDSLNVELIARNDRDKIYELAGSQGRHYYDYNTDTINHTLTLYNKNKKYKGEKLVLQYSRPDQKSIVLKGVNYNNDSLYVVLEKLDKKYLFPMGRTRPIKL
jgi:uncharacterized membrane protein YphA (DoxX/SURF4 family)